MVQQASLTGVGSRAKFAELRAGERDLALQVLLPENNENLSKTSLVQKDEELARVPFVVVAQPLVVRRVKRSLFRRDAFLNHVVHLSRTSHINARPPEDPRR